MKALDKYILREFVAPLMLVVLGLASLVMLVEVVDMLPRLREWHAPGYLILFYHLARFPYLASQVMPVGVMLATLIALGGLARNSELAAARAGGISTFRIALPVLVAAALLSVALLLVNETLIPRFSLMSREVLKVRIEKRNINFDVEWRNRMAKSLFGNRQLYAAEYDGARGVMREVILIQRRQGRIVERYDAKSMQYSEGEGWKLNEGVERTFSPEGEELSLRHFSQWPLPEISEKPVDFMADSDRKEQDLLQLSISELQGLIDVLRQTGSDYRKELVCLNLRLSYPFSCLILALLGVSLPFLFPSGRRAMAGAALGILVSLGCGMIYLVFIQVGISLGKSGNLPIILSAWLGNLVFAGVGAYTLWKVNR